MPQPDNEKAPYTFVSGRANYDFDDEMVSDIRAYINRLRAKSAGTGPIEGGSVPDATGDSSSPSELVRAGIQRSPDFERVDIQSISADMREPDPTVWD